MGLCVDLGYGVETDTVNVPDTSNGATHTFRVTDPTGKKPISGGFTFKWSDYPIYKHITANNFRGMYPDGNDWVFEFVGASLSGGYDVDLYVVCVNV